MTYSQPKLVREVRQLLNDNPFQDTCTEAMDTTEIGLDVTSTTKYQVGQVVEFSDGERCLITALASATTLTVIRNYDDFLGTGVGTGTSHSINAVIVKDPVFPYARVVDAISDAIDGLWPYVYKGVDYTITPVAGTSWYEVDSGTNTAKLRDYSTIYQIVNGKPFLYATRRTSYPARLNFGVDTATFGSGVAINIPYLRSTATNIVIKGIAPITDTLSSTNYADFTDRKHAMTIRYFAVANLVEGTGIARVTQEDLSMGDENVLPGTRENIADYWYKRAVRERRTWELELKDILPRHYKKAGDGS